MIFENYLTRTRRIANYPYEQGVTKTVSMEMDTIFPGDNDVHFTFQGDNALKIDVWKYLFHIESRYEGTVITKRKSWIDKVIIKNRNQILITELELRENIQEVIQDIQDCGKYICKHLELSFWQFVLHNSDELELLRIYVNEERLIKWP